jgi:hypothetical protein
MMDCPGGPQFDDYFIIVGLPLHQNHSERNAQAAMDSVKKTAAKMKIVLLATRDKAEKTLLSVSSEQTFVKQFSHKYKDRSDVPAITDTAMYVASRIETDEETTFVEARDAAAVAASSTSSNMIQAEYEDNAHRLETAARTAHVDLGSSKIRDLTATVSPHVAREVLLHPQHDQYKVITGTVTATGASTSRGSLTASSYAFQSWLSANQKSSAVVDAIKTAFLDTLKDEGARLMLMSKLGESGKEFISFEVGAELLAQAVIHKAILPEEFFVLPEHIRKGNTVDWIMKPIADIPSVSLKDIAKKIGSIYGHLTRRKDPNVGDKRTIHEIDPESAGSLLPDKVISESMPSTFDNEDVAASTDRTKGLREPVIH